MGEVSNFAAYVLGGAFGLILWLFLLSPFIALAALIIAIVK